MGKKLTQGQSTKSDTFAKKVVKHFFLVNSETTLQLFL